MGLFSRKKPEEKEELPPLTFPELPKKQVLFPEMPKKEFPEYESTITPREEETIKRAVKPSEFRINIPQRKPMPDFFSEKHSSYGESNEKYREGRNMFVKIENYKDAMHVMDKVKDKLDEAEKILKRLDDLKQQEDNELTMWHQDLENLKEKLLTIDRTLFE